MKSFACPCGKILHSVGLLRTNLETMPIKSPVGARSCLCTNSVWLFSRKKYAFNWFWSVVICKARKPEFYKALKTYVLWWFRRHRTEVPLTLLLHRNLNHVMECGVTNPFSTIERSIEGGLCQVNIPREGTPGQYWPSLVCSSKLAELQGMQLLDSSIDSETPSNLLDLNTQSPPVKCRKLPPVYNNIS